MWPPILLRPWLAWHLAVRRRLFSRRIYIPGPGIFSRLGQGLPAPQDIHLASGQQGRSQLVVPSFVTTFAAPVPSLGGASQAIAQSNEASMLDLVAKVDIPEMPGVPTPTLHQPFVVGPVFSPIPAKIVAQIVAGKYLDLRDLLAPNLVHNDSEPQLLFDGRLVLTSTPKKQRRRVDDLGSWVEAFTIFFYILTSYFPHRWQNLTQYKLLILRTHRQFNGRVWLAYDQAFREFAAATKLVDWSAMNVQLYNFHSAGASVRSLPGGVASDTAEAHGSTSSQVVCKSWNRGRCSAPYSSCRFAHKCNSCSGSHRAQDCPGSSSTSQVERRHRSRSPLPTAHESSKFRKY